MTNFRLSAATCALMLGMTGLAMASGSEPPPPRPAPPVRLQQSRNWFGTLSGSGSGSVAIRSLSPDAGGTIGFRLGGLRPKALYSFWTVDGRGTPQGLGASPFQAQADASGNLNYTARLNNLPSGVGVTVLVREVFADAQKTVLEGQANPR